MTTRAHPPVLAAGDAELTDFIHRWARAIVTNDIETMAPFTSDDWVLIDKPGVITRDAFHKVVASGMLRHDTMTHEVLEIRQWGHVAIVHTHGRNTGTFQGSPIEADEWTTSILVANGNRWRCVMTQLTPRMVREATNSLDS